jgi:ABC-type Na+ efflux pump permease subunit
MDGRIVGVTAATVTLIVLWFVALGLFTSLPGVLLAGLMAPLLEVELAVSLTPAVQGIPRPS